MKENDIRKYAELMKELELTGLEITENNQVVRLERSPAAKLPQTPGSSFLPGAAHASARMITESIQVRRMKQIPFSA